MTEVLGFVIGFTVVYVLFGLAVLAWDKWGAK